MTLLMMVKYEWFEEWKDTPVRKRGDDYLAYKMRFANNAFDWACSQFPKLRDKVTIISTMQQCQYFELSPYYSYNCIINQ